MSFNIKQYEPICGNWFIDREIGQGSFGKVYKILRNDWGEEQEAALKHLRIPNSESELLGFRNSGMTEDDIRKHLDTSVLKIIKEVRILYKLKGHSNIVTYEDYEVRETDSGIQKDIFIKMELLSPLDQWLYKRKLEKGEVLRLGIEICNALIFCHSENIIHRDIKNENIFVSKTGTFKLGDFGIAKEFSKTYIEGTKIGTPSFMAPEISLHKNYDKRVDIYSVGIVLYKLLNYGRLPLLPNYPESFTYEDTQKAFSDRRLGKKFPPPQGADPMLSNVILKASAFNRENRYQTASEMKKALEDVLKSYGSIDLKEIVTACDESTTNEPTESFTTKTSNNLETMTLAIKSLFHKNNGKMSVPYKIVATLGIAGFLVFGAKFIQKPATIKVLQEPPKESERFTNVAESKVLENAPSIEYLEESQGISKAQIPQSKVPPKASPTITPKVTVKTTKKNTTRPTIRPTATQNTALQSKVSAKPRSTPTPTFTPIATPKPTLKATLEPPEKVAPNVTTKAMTPTSTPIATPFEGDQLESAKETPSASDILLETYDKVNQAAEMLRATENGTYHLASRLSGIRNLVVIGKAHSNLDVKKDIVKILERYIRDNIGKRKSIGLEGVYIDRDRYFADDILDAFGALQVIRRSSNHEIQVELRSLNFNYISLKTLDLEGFDFSHSTFRYAFLPREMKNVKFNFSDLSFAAIWNSDMSGSNFQKSILSSASFVSVNLSNTNIEEAFDKNVGIFKVRGITESQAMHFPIYIKAE